MLKDNSSEPLKQEETWRNIVNEAGRGVKSKYPNVIHAIEMGAYIKPEHYFMAYVFKTDKELEQAKESGLLAEINEYHKELLRQFGYPEEGITDCTFASQQTCDREFKGNWYYYFK